jgi:hypothetical protein
VQGVGNIANAGAPGGGEPHSILLDERARFLLPDTLAVPALGTGSSIGEVLAPSDPAPMDLPGRRAPAVGLPGLRAGG